MHKNRIDSGLFRYSATAKKTLEDESNAIGSISGLADDPICESHHFLVSSAVTPKLVVLVLP